MLAGANVLIDQIGFIFSQEQLMRAHSPDPHPWPEPDPHPDPMPDPRPEPVPYRGDPPVRIIDLPPNTPTPGIPVEHR